MKRTPLLIPALIGVFALAACSNALDSVEEAVSSLPVQEDITSAMGDIQAQIDQVATEIDNSEAADQLSSAWSDVQAAITSSIDALTSGEIIDTESIQTALDDFGAELEAAGDAVSDELRSAWEELRTTIEQLLN